jgi:hypothetical protein
MGPGVLNAIGINAASSDVVVLSGLDLNGKGSGSFGVAITGATGKVQIRNTVVQGFGAFGVNWAGSASSQLFIANSDIHDNSINVNFDATTAAASGLNAHMNNVRISNGSIGVQVNSSSTALGVNANLRDCVITGASTAGVLTGGTGYAVATVVNSLLTGNFGPALMAQGGSGTSVIRVGNSSILVNARGVQTSGVGQVRSYGDNNLDGNSVDGAFTAPVLAKK